MALRTQLDAAQIMVDGLITAAQQPAASNAEAPCPHKDSVDVGTMGDPLRKYCRACATFYSENTNNHSTAIHSQGLNEGGQTHG